MLSSGSIRKYGDNIDTDVIIPARYLSSRDPEFLANHCMEGVDPNFRQRIQQGDVLVAGDNFGCGSSREHAVIALQAAGIACVVAASYARIFYRNAINQGFPILVCPGAAAVAREGQPISVDVAAGWVEVEGERFAMEPFPEFLQAIIAHGGIVPFVRARLQAEAVAKGAVA